MLNTINRRTRAASMLGALAAAVLLGMPAHTPAQDQTPEDKGLEIAKEADLRDLGWGDMKANMVMLLRNKRGDESTREMRLSSLEVTGDGDKSLTTFDTPKDVKGTAFLSHTHVTGADDQWLYLPALKRVKRISSNNKCPRAAESWIFIAALINGARLAWSLTPSLPTSLTNSIPVPPERPASVVPLI